MALDDVARWALADRPGSAMGDFAREATCVPASMPCPALDRLFNLDRSLTSVVVVDRERIGLIDAAWFAHLLAGRLGYGRSLLARQTVGHFADWGPLVVTPTDRLGEVCALAMGRPEDRRQHDVLIVDPQRSSVSSASTATLVAALARAFAQHAVRDPLTQLATRELFFHELSSTCERLPRDRCAMVAYVDLDRFKSVNDTHGHDVGDQVIVAAAEALLAAVRDHDLVARLGGDGFAVLYRPVDPGFDPHDAGERLRAAVSRALRSACMGVSVTASVGMATSRTGDADADTLVREADLAMSPAKRVGGDAVRAATDVEQPQLDASLDGAALAAALARDELRVHFQPIVDLSTRATVAMEALVRWQHPKLGLLAPGRFLPLALTSGLAQDLDEWVLRHACATVVATGRDTPILNVNLSPATVAASGLARRLEAVLDDVGFDANELRLELPETTNPALLDSAAAELRAVQQLGVSLVLDDVGAGSSSLRHLTLMGAVGLKVDRGLVAKVAAGGADTAVVRLLADLAAGLGIDCTAEGVERAEQHEALVELGCPTGQGYLYGHPRPGTPAPTPFDAARGSGRLTGSDH